MATPIDPIACVDERELGRPYAYMLGLYLGDGMLSLGRRHVWRLRVVLDERYPDIIAAGKRALADVGGRRVGTTKKQGCVEISGYWKHWICLFPQHGKGRKHE